MKPCQAVLLFKLAAQPGEVFRGICKICHPKEGPSAQKFWTHPSTGIPLKDSLRKLFPVLCPLITIVCSHKG